MSKKIANLIIPIVLVVLAVLILNPFELWMPDIIMFVAVGILAAVFGIFAIFVWRERAVDERDELHILLASRVAFLTGGFVLVLGIIVEAIDHSVDVWLVVALACMVAAKSISRFYSGRNR